MRQPAKGLMIPGNNDPNVAPVFKAWIKQGLTCIGRRAVYTNCVIASKSVPTDKGRTKEGYYTRADIMLQIETKTIDLVFGNFNKFKQQLALIDEFVSRRRDGRCL